MQLVDRMHRILAANPNAQQAVEALRVVQALVEQDPTLVKKMYIPIHDTLTQIIQQRDHPTVQTLSRAILLRLKS